MGTGVGGAGGVALSTQWPLMEVTIMKESLYVAVGLAHVYSRNQAWILTPVQKFAKGLELA